MNVLENIENDKYENTMGWHYDGPKEAQMEHRQQYRLEDARLRNQFQADLEEEFGTGGEDWRQQIFDYAWSEGHSEGYRRVYYVYEEIASL